LAISTDKPRIVFVNEEGKNLRPDFQILLPDNRLIITDSKVSLIGYEKYCANDNQQLQKTFIEDHLKSIYSHIDSLSAKKYESKNFQNTQYFSNNIKKYCDITYNIDYENKSNYFYKKSKSTDLQF
jgi:hypothetical protein